MMTKLPRNGICLYAYNTRLTTRLLYTSLLERFSLQADTLTSGGFGSLNSLSTQLAHKTINNNHRCFSVVEECNEKTTTRYS